MFGDGVAGDGGEHLDALPAGAAEQRVHRLADRLPEDVPERDVDGAQRREEHRAGEVGVAGHRLEVMLDPPRVLAAEILREIVDRLEDQAVVRPEPGLAGADDAVARVHLHEQAPVDEKRRDAVDLHRCASAVIGPLPPARRSRRSRYARRSRAGRRRRRPLSTSSIRHRPPGDLRLEERVDQRDGALRHGAVDLRLRAGADALAELVVLEREDLAVGRDEVEVVGPDALAAEEPRRDRRRGGSSARSRGCARRRISVPSSRTAAPVGRCGRRARRSSRACRRPCGARTAGRGRRSG